MNLEEIIKKRWELNHSVEDTVRNLIKDLEKKGKVSLEQKHTLISFCMNTGFYSLALSLFQEWLSKGESFPLGHFIELLNLEIKTPEADLLDALFQMTSHYQLELCMTSSQTWDQYDFRFDQLRKDFYEKKENLLKNRKNFFIEKLQFFRSQKMFKEEVQFMKKTFKTFPDDEEVLSYLKNFTEKWSKDTLSKHQTKIENQDFVLDKKPSSEEKQCFEVILEQIFKKTKKNPLLAYDFSFLFFFMEKYDKAFEILSLAPSSSFEKDTHSAELLIFSSRYFESLELLSHIQQKHFSHPEMPYSVTYLRAQAFKGLGFVSKAVHLLKEISKFRPNYRLTNYWIEKWGA